MKTSVVAGVCVAVVLVVWFGGWYLYEDLRLYSENMPPTKFTNLLIALSVGAVIGVLGLAYQQKRHEQLVDIETEKILKTRNKNPSLKSLSEKIDKLTDDMNKRFDSVESTIEDMKIAKSLAPKTET